MKNINERIADLGILPVIKLQHPDRDAAPLAKALAAGGVLGAEITFRAEGAERAIKIMRETCPKMLVGAGTVISTEQVDKAIAAGAEFIVSPGFDKELVLYCLSKNIAVYPGCITPSEYQAAIKLGLEILKFFPAELSGGLAKIKALAAPFPQVKIMPTGGITLENLGKYLACGAVCACGGSYMAANELIESGRWDEITRLCLMSSEIVKAARR